MRIVQVSENIVRWITPYKSWDEVPPFASNIILMEAPDGVREGWLYTNGEFHEPESQIAVTEPYQPTNAEVAQLVTELFTELIIAGVLK